jgi:hypothetical protein
MMMKFGRLIRITGRLAFEQGKPDVPTEIVPAINKPFP